MNPIILCFGIGRSGRAALWLSLLTSAVLLSPCLAQTESKGTAVSSSPATTSSSSATTATGQPSEADMMKMMMELSKLNENHKLLASLDGSWDYTVKMWMNGDPSSKPDESKGTATRKSIMDGRYVEMDVKGKFNMPGPDGKMTDMDFSGHGTEGYDNAKKKFVGTWMDNMGTGIVMSEGTYDAATKTFTYTADYEMAPGMKQKIREVLKVPDTNHMTMEWYEDRGGKEAKTMEINYTRKK
ncbi:MAG: DUF1579 domain-containing protein [Chthoniobacterales bacterium]